MRQALKEAIFNLGKKYPEMRGIENLLVFKETRQLKKIVFEIIYDISMDEHIRDMGDYEDKIMILWLLHNLIYDLEGIDNHSISTGYDKSFVKPVIP